MIMVSSFQEAKVEGEKEEMGCYLLAPRRGKNNVANQLKL